VARQGDSAPTLGHAVIRRRSCAEGHAVQVLPGSATFSDAPGHSVRQPLLAALCGTLVVRGEMLVAE
jgi:hypothetical protein